MKTQTRIKPRRVDFNAYSQDLQVVMLASIGFYTKAIADIVGLSASQVVYRLSKSNSGWQRRQYRQGTSQAAKAMMFTATAKNSSVRKGVINRLRENELYVEA